MVTQAVQYCSKSLAVIKTTLGNYSSGWRVKSSIGGQFSRPIARPSGEWFHARLAHTHTHCMRSTDTVGLQSRIHSPAQSVPTDECTMHPEFLCAQSEGIGTSQTQASAMLVTVRHHPHHRLIMIVLIYWRSHWLDAPQRHPATLGGSEEFASVLGELMNRSCELVCSSRGSIHNSAVAANVVSLTAARCVMHTRPNKWKCMH